MHNKMYDDITIFTKFFVMIFVILIFIISKSIYMALFTPLLLIYLLIINSERINKYLRQLRNYLLLLILILIILLLIFGISFMFIYKYIVIVLLINIFVLELSFEKTNTLIYRIIRSRYLSYAITLRLYHFNCIFSSKDELDSRMRYSLITRLVYAKHKTQKLDKNLKTNFYTIKNERTNLLSVVLFIFFLFLLIIVIIRK